MYHYLTNANFRKTLKEEGTKLTQQLCHQLKIDHDLVLEQFVSSLAVQNAT